MNYSDTLSFESSDFYGSTPDHWNSRIFHPKLSQENFQFMSSQPIRAAHVSKCNWSFKRQPKRLASQMNSAEYPNPLKSRRIFGIMWLCIQRALINYVIRLESHNNSIRCNKAAWPLNIHIPVYWIPFEASRVEAEWQYCQNWTAQRAAWHSN